MEGNPIRSAIRVMDEAKGMPARLTQAIAERATQIQPLIESSFMDDRPLNNAACSDPACGYEFLTHDQLRPNWSECPKCGAKADVIAGWNGYDGLPPSEAIIVGSEQQVTGPDFKPKSAIPFWKDRLHFAVLYGFLLGVASLTIMGVRKTREDIAVLRREIGQVSRKTDVVLIQNEQSHVELLERANPQRESLSENGAPVEPRAGTVLRR